MCSQGLFFIKPGTIINALNRTVSKTDKNKQVLYVIQCSVSQTVIKLAISVSITFDLIKHIMKRKLIIVKRL